MARSEITQDWLSITRAFKPSEQSTIPIEGIEPCEKNENYEKRAGPFNQRVINILATNYLEESHIIAHVLGIIEDAPGDYDNKASVAGGIPPLQAVRPRPE